MVSQSPRSGESIAQGGSVTLRVSNGLGSGDGTIKTNVADGSVTGHHHTWVALAGRALDLHGVNAVK